MRTECDFIGEVQLPKDALYGIHAYRAAHNFPDNTRFHIEWYRAAGSVKKACYITYKKFAEEVSVKHPGKQMPIPLMDAEITDVLIKAAGEIEDGHHFEHFIVPAIQGGAGTSINMNINEIIANRALLLQKRNAGDYNHIHPIGHANIFQSTNDVIPTAMKIAVLTLIQQLELSINNLRSTMEDLEKRSKDHLRIGYTEMQEAVPSTYGRLFSTYSEALNRDWWRTSKCSERIKTVNIGGSAIGSGITVPRVFIREIARTLQQITGLPVTRAENLYDATSNLDSLVEVHATLKSHAVNLEKMVSDLRLLSSDLMTNREVTIPQLQTGSSIMPGKVNPVIAEFIISAVHKIYANDQMIGTLCGQGNLELNAYIPVIGHALIETIKLLIACDKTLDENMVKGIQLNPSQSMANIVKSPSLTTALIPFIGYMKAADLAGLMKKDNIDLFEANKRMDALDEESIKKLVDPENILKEGFDINDIIR